MARNRMIKPEFFTSEQVTDLSIEARLLFVGLWCFCDDRGVHPASPKRAKLEVFPADDVTVSQVERMIRELLKSGLLAEFADDQGEAFWHVTGWSKHQRIDRPSYRYPAPPESPEGGENSTNARRTLDEDSSSTRRTLDDHSTSPRPEREREKKGKLKEKENSPPTPQGGERTRRKSAAKFDPLAAPIPEALATPEFHDAWADWCAHRAELGKRMTERTTRQQLTDLAVVGPELAIATIRESIRGGWQGLFPEKALAATNGHRLNGRSNGTRLTHDGLKSFVEGGGE